MDELDLVLSGERVPIDHDELIPGTVHLVDVAHNLHIQRKGESDIILQPQPLKNVNDPLRWSQRKKNLQFLLLFIWSFFLAVTVNWSGPFWTEWTEEFNCTYDQLNVSSALCFLFLGLGCLFLQPTAMKLGRRFVYLTCTLLAIVANAIGINATNVQYLMAINAISGFAAAPVDSLVEISSTDVFFTHERASKLSWLVLALYFGSDIGPVVAGYLPDWRWAFRLQVIIFCVLFVFQLFLMEDSTFARKDEDELTEENILEQMRSREIVLSAVESGVVSEKDNKIKHIISGANSEESGEEELEGTKRGYWKSMQLLELEFNERRPWHVIFIRPFFMISFPAIIWGGISYGAQMMWLSLLATTQSEIYTTYYNFSTASTGLTNLAPLIGSFFGMLYGGPFVDWLSIKMAKRNNGILEAEFRLWPTIGVMVINAAGLLAYGLGSVNVEPWPLSVVVGQGFLGFAMSSSGPITMTYAIECYPKLASEGLVLMLFVRNLIGTGFTWALQAWLDHNGLTVVTWLMFMLSLVINGAFIIFIIWGKTFRKMTRSYYYKISNKNFPFN
ncbi:CIC11C00000003152 [Sungouiella intermedia]|uniref:CIC11C00000003152 n=1 Tax=Sungouiella intermedia TaxID=45354 RepID=A0A1L0BW51_9ASCO|nr:CIC11C00000003152 [[Candida] intermedia]